MNKNDIIELKITGLGKDGEGIGHYEGMAVFVSGALPGDEIRAGITRVKKTYAYARIISLISPSSARISSPCPVSDRCGGCSLMGCSYEVQLGIKENIVADDLVRIGGFDRDYIDRIKEPVIGMDDPLHYRNKASIPVGRNASGEVVTGFYARHSHRIVEPDRERGCLIGDPLNGPISDAVVAWMDDNNISPYDEKSGKGLVRHILIRKGMRTGHFMVCLVINGKGIPSADSLVDRLMAVFERTGDTGGLLKSVCININRVRGNTILGERTEVIWGEPCITDYVGDIAFDISARSFFQVNPVQMERLYSKALEYADLSGRENVYDLYSGIGTISLFLARSARHVIGIEIVPDAVKDAKRNARLNAISNVSFFTGATEDVLPKLVAQENNPDLPGHSADVVVLDPPRKGAEESVLRTILSVEPERIVYVSCDSATLARDLKILTEDGTYRLEKYTPVDQFPETMHVETVCLLCR